MDSKEIYFYLTVVVVVLIVVFGVYIVLNLDFSEYKHVVVKGNVEFVSGSAEPSLIIDSIRSSDTLVFSPAFVASGEENSYMVEALTMFSTVFSAKGKNLVVLARVFDSSGNMVSCNSNFGDLKRNEEVSLEECKKMLSDKDSAIILVQLPSNSRKARVVLEGKSAEIISPNIKAVPYVSFALLEAIYPDSANIIKNVNLALSGMK
jgi:hypothetical protein